MQLTKYLVAAALSVIASQASAADTIRVAYQTPPSPALAAIVDGAYEKATGATIVQRFGTKAALVRAAMSRAWDNLDADTAAADAAAPMGARGVVDLLVRVGLAPRFYLGAYSLYLRLLVPAILEQWQRDVPAAEARRSR